MYYAYVKVTIVCSVNDCCKVDFTLTSELLLILLKAMSPPATSAGSWTLSPGTKLAAGH